ncbi:unnamed protein product [Spirodela intermedia]|uniref:Aminotransferase class V domain-containing protein n=1 Tax=Spirodela intermedia TaxID=51605 RepID=A0A7I8I8U1_SPIIN|nr:unnamed protein product [Spirodela intermedia]CAA6653843.1 unnamed protein product [Spirodela intermedia]
MDSVCSPVNGHHAAAEDAAGRNGGALKKLRSFPIGADEVRREFGHHDPSVARINNGSFGSCPASVLAAQQRLQGLWLRQPDDFFFNELQPAILRSRQVIKSLINADHVEEVSIVDNATTAAAIVFQRVQRAFQEGIYDRGDAVVLLHYAYGSVKKSAHAYVPLPFPVTSEEEVVGEFRKALEVAKDGGRRKVRLAVIDHITSMPSVVIPVKRLTKICREEGVEQVFVDAAHALGNVEIDIREIGPTSTPATSTSGSSASVRCIPVLGINGIMKRNHDKVVEMGKMLAGAWGTCLGSPPEMSCSMIMVGLPGCLRIASDEDAQKLRRYLREEFRIEVPTYHNATIHGEEALLDLTSSITGYVRISHQVYNSEEDYYRLRDAINKVVKCGITCQDFPSN